MKKANIGISSDCVCDLPAEYIESHSIGILYFYMIMDTGRFRDNDEVTSANIIEYYRSSGKKAVSDVPPAEEYAVYFKKQLEKYEQIIHISISSGVSVSFERALAGKELLGELSHKVSIVDSLSLSTGMAHLVMKAVELRDSGSSSGEIVVALNELRPYINTAFITKNADYMYINGRASKGVAWLSRTFNLHPVFKLKDGKLVVKGIGVGRIDKAYKRNVKRELKGAKHIDGKCLFFTHAGLSSDEIKDLLREVEKYKHFEKIVVANTSATVTSNCGEGTFGLLFLYEH